jgi:hypothetical protein
MEKRQLIEPGSIEQGIRDLSEGVRAMQWREAITRWATRVGLFLAGAVAAAGAMALAGWS